MNLFVRQNISKWELIIDNTFVNPNTYQKSEATFTKCLKMPTFEALFNGLQFFVRLFKNR